MHKSGNARVNRVWESVSKNYSDKEGSD